MIPSKLWLLALFLWCVAAAATAAASVSDKQVAPSNKSISHDTSPPKDNPTTTSSVSDNVKHVVHDDSLTTRQNSTGATQTSFIFNKQANGVVLRSFYVIVGVMSIILVYFVVRMARSRYRHSKTRRYGIIATRAAELEMQPLDRLDDEEEETTLFEANKR
uniref:Secreted protein n=2 Tax=Ixodes ricinus TaxID=34613 RepID=V5HAL4_IXORI